MIHVETPRPSKGVLLAADDAVAAVQDTLARHLRPGESGCEVVTEELIAWHLRSLRRLLARRAAVDSGRDGNIDAVSEDPTPWHETPCPAVNPDACPNCPPGHDCERGIYFTGADGGEGGDWMARPHKPAPPSRPPRKPINTKPIRA